MRNFLRLAQGVDVVPLLHAVQSQPSLWNAEPVRTFHPQSVHRGVDDILLRYNPFRVEGSSERDFVEQVCAEVRCVNYAAFAKLPQARPVIFDLMRRVEGEQLGRVMIARLAPGATIPLHDDRIRPAEELFPDKTVPAVFYDRYHIVLKSQPGVLFKCGDEQVSMETGSVWWFDNLQPHEVTNATSEDRIHLIVDIRPSRMEVGI